MSELRYPFIVRPLTQDEGGGFLIEFPDLPGCVSDGETVEEAIVHGRDAVEAWIATAREHGDPVPDPGPPIEHSGRWLQRVPRSLHARLADRAREEGVSLNAIVTALLAEWLGRGQTKKSA